MKLYLTIAFLPVYISAFFFNKLDILRYKIDIIDKSIYNLICQRIKYAKQTTKLKPTIYNPKREEYILTRLKTFNKYNKYRINETLIDDIWYPLLNHSRFEQFKLRGEEIQSDYLHPQ